MKSVKAQLLVTLAAVAAAAGFFLHRGPPPGMHLFDAVEQGEVVQVNAWFLWCGDHWGSAGIAYDESLHTLFLYAIELDHPEVVRVFIAYTEDVNAEIESDYYDRTTPLRFAVIKRSRKTTELLIELGAGVHAKDEYGWTLLHDAANWGPKEVVALLLAEGLDVNSKASDGETPLHCATHIAPPDVMALLIARGAMVNATDESGDTPLHKAAAYGREAAVKLLVAAGADVNAKDKCGRTPLHKVAYDGRYDLGYYKDAARVLIDNGAEVNAKDKWGRAPLRLAIEEDRKEVADLLRRHGAKE